MPVTTVTPEEPEPSGIVEVVAKHTVLRLCNGGDLRGLCPFCGSAAFRCRPTHGTFHCFNCGSGGDSRAFTTQIDQVA